MELESIIYTCYIMEKLDSWVCYEYEISVWASLLSSLEWLTQLRP